MQIINKSHSAGIFRFMLFVLCFLILSFQGMAQTGGENQNQSEGDENKRVQSLSETAGEGPQLPADEATVAKGKELFGQHCNVCHGVGQQIIGPALASIHQRRPLAWTISFVKNSQRMIHEEEDEYAQQLFKQYNQQVMPPFEFLSNDDILAILAYIKSESEASTAYGGVNSGEGGGGNINQSPEANITDGDEGEAYSQKDEDQQKSDEVSSGIPGALTFGLIIGTLILLGIIYAVARKSSASKSSRKAR